MESTTISLKHAARLQRLINEEIKLNALDHQKEIRVPVTNTVDIKKMIHKKEEEERNKSNIIQNLILVKYEIREAVSEVNNDSGISSLLTQKARNEELVELHEVISSTNQTQPSEDFIDKIVKKSENNENEYTSYLDYNFSWLSEDTTEHFKENVSRMKAVIRKIEQKLEELNYSHRITLSDKAVTTLTKHGLLSL